MLLMQAVGNSCPQSNRLATSNHRCIVLTYQKKSCISATERSFDQLTPLGYSWDDFRYLWYTRQALDPINGEWIVWVYLIASSKWYRNIHPMFCEYECQFYNATKHALVGSFVFADCSTTLSMELLFQEYDLRSDMLFSGIASASLASMASTIRSFGVFLPVNAPFIEKPLRWACHLMLRVVIFHLIACDLFAMIS